VVTAGSFKMASQETSNTTTASYKHLKEAFVSNLSGGTATEVNSVLAVGTVCGSFSAVIASPVCSSGVM
jgi:hypothetical protein